MLATSVDDRAIFEVARKIGAPEARRAYLEQICGHDPLQRERIDALLRAHDQHPSFLEASPCQSADLPTFDAPIGVNPGSQIGPYKLLEQIGEGGHGCRLCRRTNRTSPPARGAEDH